MCNSLFKLLLISSLLSVAASIPANAKDEEIEYKLELTKICDMRVGAPVGPECSGFITALVQAHQFGLFLPDWTPQFCTPVDVTAKEIAIKLRPWFRKHPETCNGKCNAVTFALAALSNTYPCK